ncbi:hypothetical protein [Flavimaricola marinus]|uniref:Gram-negative bacterial tonB protein n=1 Tax=Flavimaricola marinus TaxID=1819565 RepID=A0A238LAN2_9RHOB|nr:hypothetical protein [Flavimaricola marinus]SMY06613.1 hypothetical protein LOM8899_00740 [Flavimaricola marinus]
MRGLSLLIALIPSLALAEGAPPMTDGERAAFGAAVSACWMVDPASPAAGVSVTVAFALSPEGRVIDNRVEMLTHSDAAPEAVELAFQAARRAVLICQVDGYALPAGKYEHWRDVRMNFTAVEALPQ